jgi:alkylation response protein AidB-like acyl-CoA dehydrogenase
LNDVRLDDVEVPVAQRIGPEDGAWKIMGEALADERHIQFPPGRVRRDWEEMSAWATETGLAEQPAVRERLGALAVRVLEVEMQALRVLDAMQKGRAAGVEAAANKVVHTLACQEIARAAMDFGSGEALVRGVRCELLWRQSLWETIGGGTSEIMRGVVAKQALGLGGRR